MEVVRSVNVTWNPLLALFGFVMAHLGKKVAGMMFMAGTLASFLQFLFLHIKDPVKEENPAPKKISNLVVMIS